MALPPTVPTSFVPKQPVRTTRRASAGLNLFMVATLILASLGLVGAGATFAYEKYLQSVSEKKAEELRQAESAISQEVVDEFIRLRDRLVSANMLLDQHVALSQFFDLLESLSIQNVQFSTLRVTTGPDRTAQIEMSGDARTFNALAAESAAFAAEKRIRRAIFSNISTADTGTITFNLQADIDPRLVVWDGPDATNPQPTVELPLTEVSTTSSATTTP